MEKNRIHTFHTRLQRLRDSDNRRAIVVALSGGVDSMCLTELLRHYATDFRLVIAHFEHGLRGAESLADAQVVQEYAKSHGIACYVQRGHLSSANPGNFHAFARASRYHFFRQVGADFFSGHPFWIATAHTADDQLERFIIRWLQGRSPALLGSNPQPDVIHLLEEIPKSQLYQFARNHALVWREDSSNNTTYALRNRIRNHLIPLLEKEYSWDTTRGRHVAAEFGALVDSYRNAVEREFRALLTPDGAIDTTQLHALDPYLQRQILVHFLYPYSASIAEGMIDQVLHCTHVGGTSTVTISATHTLYHCYGELSVCQNQASASDPFLPVTIRGCGTFQFGDTSLSLALATHAGRTEKTSIIRLSDEDFPLTLRTRCAGDYLHRTAGRVSLKKFFIDQKIPRDARPHVFLLVDAKGAVRWIAGVGSIPSQLTPTQKEYCIDVTPYHPAD